MIKVLERYGAPPKFRESIRRLYTDLKVVVKIGKEKAEIEQQVGVRQGDNVSSVIFLFLMSAFAETLEKEWASSNISQARFKNITNMQEGQLTGHTKESMRRGINFVIHQILYIDDGAFFFETREDAENGLEMIHRIFALFGLEMHIGRGEQLSKTEIMYVPKSSFYCSSKLPQALTPPRTQTATPADDTTDDNEDRITDQPEIAIKKRTFSNMSQKEREILYDMAQETNRMKIADGFIDFVKHFKYLGSYISFDLTDDFDINHRITTANKAMGALKHVWNNPYADLKAKQQIFIAIPGNLLLWGCESWALRRSHITKLEVFWHRSIRRILKIGIMQVKEERITNERIR